MTAFLYQRSSIMRRAELIHKACSALGNTTELVPHALAFLVAGHGGHAFGRVVAAGDRRAGAGRAAVAGVRAGRVAAGAVLAETAAALAGGLTGGPLRQVRRGWAAPFVGRGGGTIGRAAVDAAPGLGWSRGRRTVVDGVGDAVPVAVGGE